MNTHTTLLGPVVPSWSHWLGRWRALQRRLTAWRAVRADDDALDSLIELDAHTLDDIGAPDALRSRAHAHREARQRALSELRVGASGADWRHW